MENVVLKIKKLLALSKSSNKNEAQVALMKAQELLAKYKLTQKEVEMQDDIKILDKKSNISFSTAKWKGILCKIIADNLGCYVYTLGNDVMFFGKEEDVNICEIMVEYAIDSIESESKSLIWELKRQGKSARGVKNDYALGFIRGLKENFEQQKINNEEWGLVLAKDKNVIDNWNEKVSKSNMKTRKLNSNINGYKDVYNSGVKNGKSFNISDKVEHGKAKDRLQLA